MTTGRGMLLQQLLEKVVDLVGGELWGSEEFDLTIGCKDGEVCSLFRTVSSFLVLQNVNSLLESLAKMSCSCLVTITKCMVTLYISPDVILCG